MSSLGSRLRGNDEWLLEGGSLLQADIILGNHNDTCAVG